MAILLPAGQAAVSALAGGITAGSIAWAYQVDNPLAVGGVAAGVTFGVSWLVALSWWRSRVEGAGDHRPVEGPPAQVYAAETLRVELESPDQGTLWVDYLDWIGDRDVLILAAAELRSRNYETSNLGGAGKTLSRSQAESVRDWLISKDLAAWVRPDAHTAGWGILPAGRAVLRRLHHLGIATGAIDPPPAKRPVITEADIYARLHTHTDAQMVYPAGLVRAGGGDDLINELWRD